MTPIRVVVIDDSPLACRILSNYLHSAGDIQVVGAINRGERVLSALQALRPQAITLDLEMPGWNGLQILETIMRHCPTPTVLISGISRRAATWTMQALDLGAIDFVLKYTPGTDTNPEELRNEIIAKVRMASQIKVIRSLTKGSPKTDEELPSPSVLPAAVSLDPDAVAESVVVIGASTGGPMVLRELLSQFPAEFPAAIVVVQHIPATFTQVLANQLDKQVSLAVKVAEAQERLRPGTVYIVPGDQHLTIGSDATVQLLPELDRRRNCPSIDRTMCSIAETFGDQAKGILLTGMGDDGSIGLAEIHSKGGETFAQEPDTCVISSMPQAAIEKGIVDHVGSPEQLGQMLKQAILSKRYAVVP